MAERVGRIPTDADIDRARLRLANQRDAELLRVARALGGYVRDRDYAPVSVVTARIDLQVRACPTGYWFFYQAASVLGLEVCMLNGKKHLRHAAKCSGAGCHG